MLMPKKSKAEQANTMDKPINLSGAGEDQAIKDLLSDDFLTMSNKEASAIGMALQQIIRGQEMVSSEIAKLNEKVERIDKEALERELAQKKYIQEVLDKAESLKATGMEKDRLIAQGLQQHENAMREAVAKRVADNLKFMEALKTMPTEQVVSPGVLVTVSENGQQRSKLIPETISIKTKTWVLPPGKLVEVPKIVADRIRDRRKSEAEQEARKNLLSQNMESSKLAEEWAKIDGKAEALPQ